MLTLGSSVTRSKSSSSTRPTVGRVLDELFERVTEEPSLNTREKLLELVREIGRREEG